VNPQAQIIQENAQPLNDAVIEDTLKQKVNELTKNSAVTDEILNRLQPEERYYYNQNFDSVTKELMKKIRLPTSKEEFSLNLAMILNNDNNRNNVLGIKNYVSPPAVVAAAATPGAMNGSSYSSCSFSGYSSGYSCCSSSGPSCQRNELFNYASTYGNSHQTIKKY
jgi:hypothetical protein